MVKIGLDNLIGTVAVIVIFISLFSIGIQTTGMVTDSSSVVNITIIPTVILNFSINHISFGEGSVDTGSDNATLDTLGNICLLYTSPSPRD